MEAEKKEKNNKPRISGILSFVETQYFRLYSIGRWSGFDTKINSTSFTAIYNGEFFNCGSSHSLKDCRKPQNNERIKANTKFFCYRNKKGNGNSDAKKFNDRHNKGKWYPPTNTKKKNRGLHNIYRK